jgi:alpha-glucosidase
MLRHALASLSLLSSLAIAQTPETLQSPDQRIEITVRLADRVRYDVAVRGQTVLRDASLGLTLDSGQLGVNPKVRSSKRTTVNTIVKPVVRQKAAQFVEHYNQLRVELEDGLAVTFRAYNEGVAYRLETKLAAARVLVRDEEVNFRFADDYTVFYPKEDTFFSHNERKYKPVKLSSIPGKAIATLPAIVEAGGLKIAVAESDIEEYPGLWLGGTGAAGLRAVFPAYPLAEKLEGDRNFKVTERADYIATTRGTRTYPWRLLAVAEKDGDLITNPLVYLLEKPTELTDTSWIRPGKVAWDWWNANNLYLVDFPAGVNTKTYKYYIDFAAKYGLEYVVLDEGWYKLGDVLAVVPEINMEELSAYAKQKKVGLILWVVWKTLDDKMIEALDQYQKWGVAGIKVDFMQRDDQKLVEFYHRLSRECAKRKMLVDYHGAQRTAMMTRTWPNLISTEGVQGLEWSKWSAETEPEHNVTLPFTRMFLGPMDFTPGATLNATRKSFAQIFDRPMALGTRCHQMGMYVVYESPLQMLADSPSNYLREPEMMEFLAKVPSVWDETKVLDAKIADYVVVARRRGADWYVGAMNDWTGRDVEIELSFLPAGAHTLVAWQDGINAAVMASDYKRTSAPVSAKTKLKLRLAPGGGWAARITAAK